MNDYDENNTKNADELMHLFEVKGKTPGWVVKTFRTNFEISQKEVSEATGISENNISAMENNRREIGLLSAKKLAAFLGIDPSFILFPDGGKAEVLKVHKEIYKLGKAVRKKKSKKK